MKYFQQLTLNCPKLRTTTDYLQRNPENIVIYKNIVYICDINVDQQENVTSGRHVEFGN
jgi:hypothetical protein